MALPDGKSRRGPAYRLASRWLAWCLWSVALAFTALALVFQVLGWSEVRLPPVLTASGTAVMAVVLVAFPSVGALIATRRPANTIGWVFCVLGLELALCLASWSYGSYSGFSASGLLPRGEVTAWVSTWTRASIVTLAVLFLLLFPDGRLPSPRWRPIAWLIAADLAILPLAVALQPGPLQVGPVASLPSMTNPFGVSGPLGDALRLVTHVGWSIIGLAALASVIALVLRARQARAAARQQFKWLAYASCAIVLTGGLYNAVYAAQGPQMLVSPLGLALGDLVLATVAGLPLAVGAAILRYRLYDIDLLINRTLVYGLLTWLTTAP